MGNEGLTPEQRLAVLEKWVHDDPNVDHAQIVMALRADPEVVALVMRPGYLQQRLGARAKTPPPRD